MAWSSCGRGPGLLGRVSRAEGGVGGLGGHVGLGLGGSTLGLDESWSGVGWFACERWAPFAVPHQLLALCRSNKNTKNKDFLVVQWLRLLSSQCRGPRFDPW